MSLNRKERKKEFTANCFIFIKLNVHRENVKQKGCEKIRIGRSQERKSKPYQSCRRRRVICNSANYLKILLGKSHLSDTKIGISCVCVCVCVKGT